MDTSPYKDYVLFMLFIKYISDKYGASSDFAPPRQAEQGVGAKVIERLAHDRRAAFPGMKGFSRAILLYWRAFAEACPDEATVQ